MKFVLIGNSGIFWIPYIITCIERSNAGCRHVCFLTYRKLQNSLLWNKNNTWTLYGYIGCTLSCFICHYNVLYHFIQIVYFTKRMHELVSCAQKMCCFSFITFYDFVVDEHDLLSQNRCFSLIYMMYNMMWLGRRVQRQRPNKFVKQTQNCLL